MATEQCRHTAFVSSSSGFLFPLALAILFTSHPGWATCRGVSRRLNGLPQPVQSKQLCTFAILNILNIYGPQYPFTGENFSGYLLFYLDVSDRNV